MSDFVGYKTCDQCVEELDEYCWCYEAKDGDYYQVFVIVLLIILMYLASYCLGYGRASVTVGGMAES